MCIRDRGQVQQVGTPLDVYDRPANKFVAGFIGSPAMNFVEGTVNAQGIWVDGVNLGPSTQAFLTHGHAVWVGVRPEHLILEAGGLAARVEVVEPLGNGTMLHLSIFGTRWVVLDAARTNVKAGDSVGLRIDAERVHVFDRERGTRLGANAFQC